MNNLDGTNTQIGDNYKADITMLSDTTVKGYTMIMKYRKENNGLLDLPSYYKLTKSRPTVVELLLLPLCPLTMEVDEEVNDTMK